MLRLAPQNTIQYDKIQGRDKFKMIELGSIQWVSDSIRYGVVVAFVMFMQYVWWWRFVGFRYAKSLCQKGWKQTKLASSKWLTWNYGGIESETCGFDRG